MPGRLLNHRTWRIATALRAHPVAGYGIAVASFTLALFLRFVSDDYLPAGFPFLTFFPAVILTAFFAGTRPGILCAVLSTLAAHYFFMTPVYTFALDQQSIVAIVFFVTVIAVDLFIIDVMAHALGEIVKERHYIHELLDRQTTLFQELQHRVANNLGFVSNLLALQSGRLQDSPDAKAIIDDAQVRLEMMSRVHRKLYDPSMSEKPLNEYLQDICGDMVEMTGNKNVTCVIDVPDVKFDLDKTLNLSLVLIEAVTNSLKHAFQVGQDGKIAISIKPYGLSHYTLTVRDNGKGFPADFDPVKGERLGFKILAGFARSLGGEISYSNDNGGKIDLTFAA